MVMDGCGDEIYLSIYLSIYTYIYIYIYIFRNGGGCLYTVVQWETGTSILQSGNWASGTIEEKAHTT